MQSEVFHLTTESKQKEHQWSAIKEAYYHDFVIAAIKAAAAQAAQAHEALKGRLLAGILHRRHRSIAGTDLFYIILFPTLNNSNSKR